MAKIFCKYHPDIPASWVCHYCQINFCKNCIQVEYDEIPACPVCGQQAHSLGTGNLIQPFWQRIPQFFRYPFQFPPLLFMLLLTVLSILVNKVPVDIMPFGILIELAMVMLFIKYAYVVLEHTAQGYLHAQRIRGKLLTENLETLFKQLFVVFLFFIGLSELSGLTNKAPFYLGMLFTTLVFPASIMVLAVEHRLMRAINPASLLGMIRRIGNAYFIMCLFLLMLLMGTIQAVDMMVEYLPASIYMPVSYFIIMFFTLVMFNLMGYVLYQYHEELGYSVQQGNNESNDPEPRLQETESALRKIEILFHEGKLVEAEERLVQMIQKHPANMQYRERFHRLLLARGDLDGLRIYSADYIGRLMLDNQPSEAFRVFTECYELDKNFKFGNGRQRFAMAQLLNKNGQARAALNLLTNLHLDFPGYEGILDAYLLAARILCESFNEDKKAHQILEFLQKKYPQHPRISQVKEYMSMVASLAQH
jgi:tetratricopeptide (TPR) repeat protein